MALILKYLSNTESTQLYVFYFSNRYHTKECWAFAQLVLFRCDVFADHTEIQI